MDTYNRGNYKKAKGTTFMFIDDDHKARECGEMFHALLADVDFKVGYSIKDINEDDPKVFLWCHNNSYGQWSTDKNEKIILHDLNVLVDLIRVKGVVKWSDFERASAAWGDHGINGSCPFN